MGRASCRDGRSRGTVVFRIDLAAVVDGAVVDGAVVGYCSSCGDYMLEEKGRALLIRWPVFICVRGLIRVWSEALYRESDLQDCLVGGDTIIRLFV